MMISDIPYPLSLCVKMLWHAFYLNENTKGKPFEEIESALLFFFPKEMISQAKDVLGGKPGDLVPFWKPAAVTPEKNGRYIVYYQQGHIRKVFIADYEREYGGWQNMWKGTEVVLYADVPVDPETALQLM